MTIDAKFIGKSYPQVNYEIAKEKVKEFVTAIKGDLSKYDKYCPPTFPVVYSADFLAAILYDPELKLNLRKLVHGEQEFIYHKAAEIGDSITSNGSIEKIFNKGPHDFVVSRVSSTNQHGDLVCESIWTFIIRGGNDRDFSLSEKLAMGFAGLMPSEEAKRYAKARQIFGEDLLATDTCRVRYSTSPDDFQQLEVFIDKYLPQRYAGASGDFNAIHLDDALGKSVGLGGYILHGMATMAMGANLAMQGRAANSISKYRARFSAPVKPCEVLTYKGKASNNKQEFAFKASNLSGEDVLSSCLIEFR